MRSALLLFASLLTGSGAFAQQASLRVSPSPHYVGVPIDIELTAEDFARSPEPTVEVATREVLRGELDVDGDTDVVGARTDAQAGLLGEGPGAGKQ